MSNRKGTGRTRRIKAHSIKIVKAATAMEARQKTVSVVRCASIQKRVRCRGYLVVRLQDIPPQVHWACPKCGTTGVIDAWVQTPWNLSRGKKPSSAPQLTWTIKESHHLVLSDVNFMDPESDRIVFSGRAENGEISLQGQAKSFRALQGDIDAQANLEDRLRRRKVLDQLNQSLTKLLNVGQSSAKAAPPPEAGIEQLLPFFPAELSQRLERSLSESGGLSRDELNRYLCDLAGTDRTSTSTLSPKLIPVEVRQLLDTDWQAAEQAIFIGRLSADRARSIPWVFNARLLLEIIEQEGPIKATAKGNFNRRFVQDMIGRLPLADSYLNALKEYRMIWNEFDVWELHILRLFCQWSGLIRCSKGKFHLTQKGRKLTQTDNSGELHFQLFSAYYHKLNLSYMDRFPENERLQATLAYSLYIIGKEANRWRTLRSLLPFLLMSPSTGAEQKFRMEGFAELQVESRILRPLIQFGLLEKRKVNRKKVAGRALSIRKSPCFDRFIRFAL